MNRRDFIKKSSLVGCAAMANQVYSNSKLPKTATRPNILFLFTDQQTMNALSANGNPYVYTPNMDSLAAFGVNFKNCYCSSPISGPSRSSLISGKMPHSTGVLYNDDKPLESIQNFGQILRNSGYKTYWAGKWHLPENYPHSLGLKEIPGFEVLDFMDRDKMSGKGEITDHPLAMKVSDFLQNKMQEPFVLGVSLHNPHDICYVPREPDRYPKLQNISSAPPLPYNFAIPAFEPQFIQDCRTRNYYGNEISMTHQYSEEDWRNYLHHYYRMVEEVDKEIGIIIEALEKAELDENTLIIFTSDHGDGGASHQWAAKLNFYEEAMRVPFIITQFGKTPKGVSFENYLCSGLDVFPTILDYAGIPIPSDCQGKSLKPLVEGQQFEDREFVVAELFPDPKNKTRMGRMIRTKTYKYNLFSYGEKREQLFDLSKDPGETIDLSTDVNLLEVKMYHKELLQTWCRQNMDAFTF